MSRIILTGGAGLIGRALAADLTPHYEVIVLSRNPDRVTDLPRDVHAERWDGRTAQGWGKLADGAEAIVNLAGESIAGAGALPGRWTAERKQKILQSRLDAGQAVVEAVRGALARPRAVIQSSGVGYYGPLGAETVAEDGQPGHDFLATVAAQWEASTAAVEAMGVRRAVIRTGVVLSTTGGAFPKLLLPYRFFVGGPLGSGRQWLPWIHIADEVAAIRFLIENRSATGAFNLAAPNPLTNAGFGKILGKVMGRPSFVPVPGFALRLLLGEMATTVLDGQRAVPRRLLESGFTFRFPDAEAALRDLLKN
ncbi:MAG: TIGR01777 family oxidoreductase [Chloroflexi bacterium]|nr:TIGR01777 family oxidoreductase [Chloroflexota bacterium]